METIEEKTFDGLNIKDMRISGKKFTDCEFKNCRFENITLYECMFADCKFVLCEILGLETKKSEVRSLRLEQCAVLGVNFALLQGNAFFSTPFENLKNCTLKYCTFMDMEFNGFDFSDNEIVNSSFAEVKLEKASFNKCVLRGTEFFKCNLKNADFKNASGYNVDVLTCGLKGAKFTYPEAVNLLYSLGIEME